MDTNKMTDAQRAEFEVAFRAKFGFGATDVAEAKSEDGAVIMGAAVWAWQASRQAAASLSDEILTAAYWDFDARRKGYPPYTAPAGQECGAFKVAIVSAIEAQGLKVAP